MNAALWVDRPTRDCEPQRMHRVAAAQTPFAQGDGFHEEDSHVREVARHPCAHATASDLGLQEHVSELMARDIQRAHRVHALLGCANAQERLAAFLLDQSRRRYAQGFSACDFHLRMSRAELGSYLCMSMETVSRTLSGMQRKGWLRVDKRHISLADVGALSRRFGALL